MSCGHGQDGCMSMPTDRCGLTLVEMLVVLAILAVVAAATIGVARTPVHRDAAALAHTLTSARWLAVASGAPTMLVQQEGKVRLIAGDPPRCDRDLADGREVWSAARPLALRWPTMDLVFGPHGRPLRCDGSAVGNTTITLTGRDGSSAAVIVAALGRVRWERR